MKTSTSVVLTILCSVLLAGCGQSGPLEYTVKQQQRINQRNAAREAVREQERLEREARISAEREQQCQAAKLAHERGQPLPENITEIVDEAGSRLILDGQHICNPPVVEQPSGEVLDDVSTEN